jgi:hypothetical protein
MYLNTPNTFQGLSPLDTFDGGSTHRKAFTCTEQQNIERCLSTSMHRLGLEHMIPVFERSKNKRALDFVATGAGRIQYLDYNVNIM